MMFRLAEEKDIDAVSQIYDMIHTCEENGKKTIGWARGVYPTRKTCETALSNGHLFVCEENGKIVATAIINHIQVPEYAMCHWSEEVPDDKIMVLHTLCVNPEMKGLGIGTKFVHFYEEYAKEKGCTSLRMDTQVINTPARTLYKKLGYTEIGTVFCEFNGIKNTELVCLEKKI